MASLNKHTYCYDVGNNMKQANLDSMWHLCLNFAVKVGKVGRQASLCSLVFSANVEITRDWKLLLWKWGMLEKKLSYSCLASHLCHLGNDERKGTAPALS